MNDKNQTANKTNKEEQKWEQYQKDLDIREAHNHLARDRAVLTLSSAFFAFSLIIARDFGSQCIVIIKTSWVLFVVVIIVTLLSFFAANKAISYCRKNDTKKCTRWRKCTNLLNIVSCTLFCIGIISVIIFAFLNP